MPSVIEDHYRCNNCGAEYTAKQLGKLLKVMNFVEERLVPCCSNCGSVQIDLSASDINSSVVDDEL